jgi:hypothetical protein
MVVCLKNNAGGTACLQASLLCFLSKFLKSQKSVQESYQSKERKPELRKNSI